MFKYIILSLLSLQAICFATSVEDTIQEANGLFQEANEMGLKDPDKAKKLYKSSALKYQSLIDQGRRNTALYKNLANAYYKAGDKGRAMLYYHRALRINPSNSDTVHSINFLRSEVVDIPPDSETNIIVKYLFIWHDMPFYLRLFLFAFLSIIAWGALAILLYQKKKEIKATAIIAGILSLILAGSLLVTSLYLDNKVDGVITVREVEPRQGNGYIYEMALTGALHSGTEFKIIETRNDWYYIELPGDSKCWIPTRSATLIKE